MSRLDSHTLTHAENVYTGDAYAAGANDSRRGIPVRLVVEDEVSAANITASDVDGVVNGPTTPSAGALALDGLLVTDGVAIFDVARCLVIVSTTTDTTQAVLITGTDQYGAPLVESIDFNGTTPVVGLKAFKTVTSIVLDIDLAGDPDIGDSDTIGLNYRVDSLDDLDFTTQGGDAKALGAGAGTLVVADTTSPATAITGDVRGTIAVDAAPFPLKVVYKTAGRKSVTAYGVPQFAG